MTTRKVHLATNSGTACDRAGANPETTTDRAAVTCKWCQDWLEYMAELGRGHGA